MKHYDELIKCAEYEEGRGSELPELGWSWDEVGVTPGILSNLVTRGLLVIKYRSNRYTGYLLTDKGREIASSTTPYTDESQPEPPKIPSTIFNEIIGYEDLKELLRSILLLEKPIHVLLHGPPSLAKTLFLWEVERIGGDQALWLVGSASSKAGIWDLMAERKPRWLLIDEIEKMNAVDLSGLLTILEGGRLVRAKVGRRLDEKLNICVLAAANRINKLPPELLSRFAIKELKPYDFATYQRVVKGVLVAYEGIPEDAARDIAIQLTGKTRDVRDAIRIARLAKEVGVDRAIELLLT